MEFRLWVYDNGWKLFNTYADISKVNVDYKELKIWYGKENVKITKRKKGK